MCIMFRVKSVIGFLSSNFAVALVYTSIKRHDRQETLRDAVNFQRFMETR